MGHRNDQLLDRPYKWYPTTTMPKAERVLITTKLPIDGAKWHRETECRMVDRFHWINQEGALSVSEIQAANIVWPTKIS